jgi:glycosyltransferase involved in cell wall biosynthesis
MLNRAIAGANGDRVLVQYVPHAFGLKAMNLTFCSWLYAIRHRGITVMFHEVAFPRRIAQPIRHNILGEITSLMATLVARSAQRIFVSSLSWEAMLGPLVGCKKRIDWLPVPSTVPVVSDLGATMAIRARYAGDRVLVGHFGTYGPKIRDYLEVALPELLRDRRVNAMLLGRASGPFRAALVRRHPAIAARLHAPDDLRREDISRHLSACDLMIQPYPDGISARRTSAMAALAHGRPVLTMSGRLTEALWIESAAVATVPADDRAALAPLGIRLLDDPSERRRLGVAGFGLYRDRFDLCHTIKALRTIDADCDSKLV